MTFLLIFRLNGPWKKIKAEKSIKIDDALHQTFLTTFINITYSRLWKIIQLQAILVRFMITTSTIVFLTDESGINVWDIINLALDLLFAFDFVAAVIHRYVDGENLTIILTK